MEAELFRGVSSEGLAVAEAELAGDDPTELIAAARGGGAELLWLHTSRDLSSFGFSRRDGYVRLHADVTPPGSPLPLLPQPDYPRVLGAAYRGLWGHKHVATKATPPADAVVVGLYESEMPVGLCTVFPSERLVDGPGVVSGHRAPSRYARLLLAACACLGAGPVDVDSWGDAPDVIRAYTELGFSIVEQVGGWELLL